jgi:hypothetical protein
VPRSQRYWMIAILLLAYATDGGVSVTVEDWY